VKSMNSVTVVVHEVTVKNGLLTYYKVSKPVLLTVLGESPCPRGSSRTILQVLVLVFEPQVFVLVLKP